MSPDAKQELLAMMAGLSTEELELMRILVVPATPAQGIKDLLGFDIGERSEFDANCAEALEMLQCEIARRKLGMT